MGKLEVWSSVMEEKMACFDDVFDRLKSAISNVEEKEEAKVNHEENIFQEEKYYSKEYEMRDKIVNEERINVKFPKLVIIKINGTSLDWFRFWNQFENEIGNAEIGL